MLLHRGDCHYEKANAIVEPDERYRYPIGARVGQMAVTVGSRADNPLGNDPKSAILRAGAHLA